MLPPEVVDANVNMDEIPKEIADIMGVPKRILRTDLEKKQRQQQQQEQKQALEEQALAMQ